jgi:hypothetical protein
VSLCFQIGTCKDVLSRSRFSGFIGSSISFCAALRKRARMNTAFTKELSRFGDEYHSVGEVKLIEPPADDEELTAWGEELKQAADVLLHNHSHPTTREHACKPFKYDGPCHVCSSIVCARELL